MQPTVGIALLGCGTVGGGVAELLSQERSQIESRCGVRYALRGIGVRSLDKDRPASIARDLFTRDVHALLDDPHVDLVIECVGGTGDAIEFIERALERRKHVVTANKDALATQGPRLYALAAAKGVGLQFEAAVCGAIPIVRALETSLAGDEIVEVAGVLNGTSNFILGELGAGRSYEAAVACAQSRGFAEADPHNDVEGVDAAHKLAILIQLAFRQAVISARIRRRGITSLTPNDVISSRKTGHEIKLLAYARKTATGCSAQVGPVLVPSYHPFANVRDANNIVRVVGRSAGALTFTGPGAGREPSASAVLGDVTAALRAIGERHDFFLRARHERTFRPAMDIAPAYETLDTRDGLPVWNDALLAEGRDDVVHA